MSSSTFEYMREIKIIFITAAVCISTAIIVEAAAPGVSVSKSHYEDAVETFEAAQKAEETAKLSSFVNEIANNYELAIEYYKLSLKQARRSAEKFEELSEREKYNRMRIINESRERIDVCQDRYDKVAEDLNVEVLGQEASKRVVEGFKYATANDKRSAKRSWDKALSLYREVLTHTKDEAAQEVIKSKIKEIEHYIEIYL